MPGCLFDLFRLHLNISVKCSLIGGVWQGFGVLCNCFIRVLSEDTKVLNSSKPKTHLLLYIEASVGLFDISLIHVDDIQNAI